MSVTAMSLPAAPRLSSGRGVGLWLFAIAAMIALMVVVGGLTRLTDSGLSITQWQPVTGVLPPLSETAWQAEFAKYRGTPQYELLNRDMSLAAFKSIYWWEWGHRLLGRLIGFVFLVPFMIFLRQGRIGKPLATRLTVIFLLGAAQGALGWWMVQSGLEGGRVAVSQYRLAAHLGLAMILFGYVFWTALACIGAPRTKLKAAGRFAPFAFAFAALILAQILLGAFVAGLDAGLAFSTWPSYGGALIAPGLFDLSPWWRNLFENHALVHFQHRNVGYAAVLFAIALFLAMRRLRLDRPPQAAGIHVLALGGAQAGLGVLTVVTQVALPLAALHQIVALGLFAAALWWAYALDYSAGTARR